jgi:hypothetical protein
MQSLLLWLSRWYEWFGVGDGGVAENKLCHCHAAEPLPPPLLVPLRHLQPSHLTSHLNVDLARAFLNNLLNFNFSLLF